MIEMREPVQTRRNLNLDLIRCVAVFCVVGVHFFLNSGYYGQLLAGRVMYVMTLIRTFCMTCVPLFMLLTGYLCNKRTMEKGFYRKLLPMLWTYLIACFFSIVYKWIVLQEESSLLQLLFRILDTNGGEIGYSWYLSMYIGLFLLMPFLNGMYHGLKTQEEKKKLLFVLFVLTVLPSILNVYDWFSPNALLGMVDASKYQRIVPEWWTNIWPLFYYFVGAYIQEYGIKLSKKWCAIFFVLAWLGVGSYVFFRSYRLNALFGPSWDWSGCYVALHSILLFIVLLRVNLSWIPRWIQWIIGRISKLSFGIYLCSYISDSYVYPTLISMVADMRTRYILMPVIVLASFGMATVMSQLIDWILSAPKWIKKHVH